MAEEEERRCLLTEKREESKSRKRGGVPQKKKSKGGSKKAKVDPLRREPRDPPAWVLEMCDDAENPRLVFEKTLTDSDVKPRLSRLLMPFLQLLINDFLTPADKQEVKKDNGVKTLIVNQSFDAWALDFKIWPMQTTLNYILNGGWNDVVRANQLKEGDKISLWTFRDGEDGLCFGLDISKDQ